MPGSVVQPYLSFTMTKYLACDANPVILALVSFLGVDHSYLKGATPPLTTVSSEQPWLLGITFTFISSGAFITKLAIQLLPLAPNTRTVLAPAANWKAVGPVSPLSQTYWNGAVMDKSVTVTTEAEPFLSPKHLRLKPSKLVLMRTVPQVVGSIIDLIVSFGVDLKQPFESVTCTLRILLAQRLKRSRDVAPSFQI